MGNRRNIAGVLGGTAAVTLFLLVNPWIVLEPNSTVTQAVTIAFWVSFLALLVVLFEMRKEPGGETIEIEGPAFTRFLFSNSRAGWFWLPVRLFLGFSWLEAGYHKFADGGWIDGGSSLLAYWERAAAIPETGRPAISYDWYRAFIQTLIDNGAESWMGWVITFGEMAVGIGLIIGLLTGFAAFFGAVMNMSFLLAGSASTNPVLFTLAIGLMLAWKVAGYYGLDRYVLPLLGTPWRPGPTAGKDTNPTAAPA